MNEDEPLSRRFEFFTSKHLEFSFFRILFTSILVSQICILTIFGLDLQVNVFQYAVLLVVINCAIESFWINRSIKRFRLEDMIDQLSEEQMKIKEIPEIIRNKMEAGLPFRPKYIMVFDERELDESEAVNRMRELVKEFSPSRVNWSGYKSALFFSEDADQEVVNFRLTFGV